MTKVISMDKKYKTRSGLPVRILCVDRKYDVYPVVGLFLDNDKEYCNYWGHSGCNYSDGSESSLDLIEVSPYEDFKVDDLCVVSDFTGEVFRYFHKEIEGVAYCFQGGKTSFTSDGGSIAWCYCRKATPEEIATKTIKKD